MYQCTVYSTIDSFLNIDIVNTPLAVTGSLSSADCFGLFGMIVKFMISKHVIISTFSALGFIRRNVNIGNAKDVMARGKCSICNKQNTNVKICQTGQKICQNCEVSRSGNALNDTVSDNRAATSDDAAEVTSGTVEKLRDEIQNLQRTVNTLQQQVGFLLIFVGAVDCNPTTACGDPPSVMTMMAQVLPLLQCCPVWRRMGPESDSDPPNFSSRSNARLLLQVFMWTFTAVN